MFTYYVADILNSGAIPVDKTDKNPYLPPRKEDWPWINMLDGTMERERAIEKCGEYKPEMQFYIWGL